MHIPSVQSLFYLSLLTAPFVSAVPLDEKLQSRATTTCNSSDVKTVNDSNKQPVTFCKSWLASKHDESTVKGLSVAQVSNACKCVQASASSSSVAAAKKTSSVKKATSSANKVTSSSSSSSKKPSSSTKTSVKAATIPTTSSKRSTSTLITSAKSTTLSKISKKSSLSSSSHSTSSLSGTKASSTAIKFDHALSTATPLPKHDASSTSGVTANNKAPVSVSTRAAQSTTNNTPAGQTSPPSANSKNAATGNNIIVNGNFNQGSNSGWHGARAVGTRFSVSSLTGDSNYQGLVKYSMNPNDNASGQLYQNVSIPANSAWQLNANIFLNSPRGLPFGVTCVVKYSLGSDSIILDQYGVGALSGTTLTDTASGRLSDAFTGRFQIDTYCNSASSSAVTFALGFGNIQLFISDAGNAPASTPTATTKAAAASTTTASSSSNTGANMLTNGNFSTGSFSGWALYRLNDGVGFSIGASNKGNSAQVSFPAGGDVNSQAGLLQQKASVKAGTTYSISMALVLNGYAGLAADGSTCNVQIYLVDGNGYGISFLQTSYTSADGGDKTITASGSNNVAFDGTFNIMLRCYGGANPIVVSLRNIVLSQG